MSDIWDFSAPAEDDRPSELQMEQLGPGLGLSWLSALGPAWHPGPLRGRLHTGRRRARTQRAGSTAARRQGGGPEAV